MTSANPHVLSSLLRWRLIEDGRIVRLIYVDEAGTGPAEPVRVVAAVIVHGDNEVRTLVSEMERIFDERVPTKYRKGFIFHAKELFSPNKKKGQYDEWKFEDRLDLIKEIVCLPFVNDIPIALGTQKSGSVKDSSSEETAMREKYKISLPSFEHALAFAKCLERADAFLRKYLDGKEVGTVIAEDVDNRKLISALGMMYKHRSLELPSDHQEPDKMQRLLGITPEPKILTITNIIDVPHFVVKKGSPLLQLADACAFSFRRYLAGYKHGSDLVLAALGPKGGMTFIDDPIWLNGLSSGLFNIKKYCKGEKSGRTNST